MGDEEDTEKPDADGASDEDVEAGAQAEFPTIERKARLIMRTDGVHRVILNTPVFKDMNVGTHDGKEPTGKTMHLTGLEDGKPTGFQIKVVLFPASDVFVFTSSWTNDVFNRSEKKTP